MLLICQSVLLLFSGSQPSFSATVAVAGTPPLTPQRWDGATFSISCRAELRWVPVSSVLGLISSRSRASWSVGVVVLRPQPGQGKPGHCTHEDGSVWVRPAEVSNDAICDGPPASSHRVVAASLSLSSIISRASEVSDADKPPEPAPCRAYSASRMFSLTTLASACGLLLPNVQVCPVVTSYTAAVTVPVRSSTYSSAAEPTGSAGAGAEAAGVGLALRPVAVALGAGVVAVARDGAGVAMAGPADGLAGGPPQAWMAASRGSPIAPARQLRMIVVVFKGSQDLRVSGLAGHSAV